MPTQNELWEEEKDLALGVVEPPPEPEPTPEPEQKDDKE